MTASISYVSHAPSLLSQPNPKNYPTHSTIDWIYEYNKELNFQKLLDNKERLKNQFVKWTVLIASAVLIGYLASLIDILSLVLSDLKTGYCGDHIFYSKQQCCVVSSESCSWNSWDFGVSGVGGYFINYVVYTVFGLIFSLISYYLTHRQPTIMKSGISEIKLIINGYVIEGFLTWQNLVYKSLGLVFVVGSGIWIGKEGPLVHVSCCLLSILMDFGNVFHKNEAIRRELLTSSVSSGISVAFNAPIGGVLFVLEQIESFFNVDRIMWICFVCSTFATMILQSVFVKRWRTDEILFDVDFNDINWFFFEIIPFIGLGVVGGVLGSLFNKLNININIKRQRFWSSDPNFKLYEIVALSLVTSLINYPLILTRLPIDEIIMKLFRDCSIGEEDEFLCLDYSADHTHQMKLIIMLTLIAVQSFFLSVYSYGSYIPGGILMPSLAIGGTIGRIVGIIIKNVQISNPDWEIFYKCTTTNCISPGSYAVVGAASFLTGVTKMTCSVVVIVFELTGALSYVLPIMVSVLVSKYINDGLAFENFYESWIKLLGFPYWGGSKENIIPMVKVRDIMRTEFRCIYNKGMVISELRSMLDDNDEEGFPLVENESGMKYLGYIYKYDLDYELSKSYPSTARVYFAGEQEENLVKLTVNINQSIIKVNSNCLLPTAVSMIRKLSLNYLLVLKGSRLIGLIDRRLIDDVMNNLSNIREAEPINELYDNSNTDLIS